MKLLIAGFLASGWSAANWLANAPAMTDSPYLTNGVVGIVERAGFAGLTAAIIWWVLSRLSAQIDRLGERIDRLGDRIDNRPQ